MDPSLPLHFKYMSEQKSSTRWLSHFYWAISLYSRSERPCSAQKQQRWTWSTLRQGCLLKALKHPQLFCRRKFHHFSSSLLPGWLKDSWTRLKYKQDYLPLTGSKQDQGDGAVAWWLVLSSKQGKVLVPVEHTPSTQESGTIWLHTLPGQNQLLAVHRQFPSGLEAGFGTLTESKHLSKPEYSPVFIHLAVKLSSLKNILQMTLYKGPSISLLLLACKYTHLPFISQNGWCFSQSKHYLPSLADTGFTAKLPH